MKTFDFFMSEAKSHAEVVRTMSRNWNRNNPGSNFNVQYRPGEKHYLYLGLIDVDKKSIVTGKQIGRAHV